MTRPLTDTADLDLTLVPPAHDMVSIEGRMSSATKPQFVRELEGPPRVITLSAGPDELGRRMLMAATHDR